MLPVVLSLQKFIGQERSTYYRDTERGVLIGQIHARNATARYLAVFEQRHLEILKKHEAAILAPLYDVRS